MYIIHTHQIHSSYGCQSSNKLLILCVVNTIDGARFFYVFHTGAPIFHTVLNLRCIFFCSRCVLGMYEHVLIMPTFSSVNVILLVARRRFSTYAHYSESSLYKWVLLKFQD